ncbi:EscU/YscU/HrcU family type III secretion system export apparatus switch protein [Shimia sp. MMG029]|uniref:EscU/YscU/HrcU family type III secretion system export apparatus switch protein n=1 Tax=Shimia sp. MMG029 TaxID=3021978 RepID=UPI0022FDFC9F|nr:flagellar type III secretion system protein FlhB [Shimia sp. MMG029]MDA5557439.1 flagellar type III secretion system protein FlhB [Shimia sp. MMG029]
MSGGGQDDDSEKSFEPTQQKLEQARKKGEIAKSADVSVAAGYLGITLAFLVIGAGTIKAAGNGLMVLLDQAESIAPLVFEGSPSAPMGGIMMETIWSIAPWFFIPMIAVILSIIAQNAFLFTPSKIQPKLSKISPISNAKNKFGRNGLFEFAKSFVKLTIYSICLGIFLNIRMPEMASSIQLDPIMVPALLGRLMLEFLMIVIVVAASIAVVDYFWQRAEHIRKNMMTRKEMTDEQKESEGDPHMKQQRRQKGQEIAMNQMLADVPEADVIIVNPTHYAVALKWSRLPGAAPICVAKGVDEIAARIREKAQEAAIPIHRDPPTARALHAIVEIGQEIPEEQYQAVAAAIRFADAMRARAKGRV